MNETYFQLSSIQDRIAYLKNNGIPLPDVEKYNSQWDETKHRIMTDIATYPDPDPVQSTYEDSEGKEQTKTIYKKLNRIPLAYQKDIVTIAVTFLYGNAVKYTNSLEDDAMFDAFQKVLDKEKIIFQDREIAKSNGRFTQCAELWWIDEEVNEYYGFPSQYRLKVNILTPDENKMYPYFNQQGDMVAFLREYKVREDGDKIKYFEVYTADAVAKLKEVNNGIEVIEQKPNPIGKIPIVWYQFENVEWSKVQPAIERLEEIQSGIGETNKKFSDPILGLRGSVVGGFSNNTGGKVFQFEGENSGGEYIQPPNASDNLANEKKSLEAILYQMSNSVNISPEALQGLGNMLATENAAFLFMLPHLKVMDKMSVYIPALKRRMSIVKSFLQLMNTSFRNSDLEAEPVITPYIINNQAQMWRDLMEVNGGQPLFSQRTTMEKAGVKNVDDEKKQIEAERESKMSNELV